jgi:exodeoxyribonuclease VII large subunit
MAIADQHAEAVAASRRAGDRLNRLSPRTALDRQYGAVNMMSTALRNSMKHYAGLRQRDLATTRALLDALDPGAVLGRGYAALQTASGGRPLFSIGQIQSGDRIQAMVTDGVFSATVNRALAGTTESERSAVGT